MITAISGAGMMGFMGIWELLIIFFVMAVFFGGILALVWLVARAARGGERRGSPDEARMIQELHQGFSHVEKRVEALEAILMERDGDRFIPTGREHEDEEEER